MKKKDYLHILMEYCRKPEDRISKYSPIKYEDMTAVESFEKTEKELRRLNTLIRHKKIPINYIGNSIFVIDPELNNKTQIDKFVNDHFTSGFYYFLALKKKMEEEDNFNEIGIIKFGYLIDLLLYDILPFANEIGSKIEKNYIFFGVISY